MTDEEFDEYLAQSSEELEVKQGALEREYAIGQHDRFVVDYETRLLTFFGKEARRVEATVLPIATHVEAQNSLSWSWANPQLPPAVRDTAARVKGLQELTGFELFGHETVECDASMAWKITAMACKFLAALGAYPIPHRNLNAYLLITQIHWISGSARDDWERTSP